MNFWGAPRQAFQKVYAKKVSVVLSVPILALEQETVLGLSGPRPKRLLAPSLSVGTKIVADPEKRFQELTREKLLIILRDRPCLELIIVASNFQGFVHLAGQITGIGLTGFNSSKRVSKNAGRALSRITIISAWTVLIFGEIQEFGPCTRQSGSQRYSAGGALNHRSTICITGLTATTKWLGQYVQSSQIHGVTLKFHA